jgi:hypothetical protein
LSSLCLLRFLCGKIGTFVFVLIQKKPSVFKTFQGKQALSLMPRYELCNRRY